MDGDTLVITGTITEAPADATADITINLKTSTSLATEHRDGMGTVWYDDDHPREAMDQEGE